MPQGPGTYGSQVGRPPKKSSVGLSKAGGDFAVGRKQAKELKKKRKKKSKTFKQKLLKALKITAKGAGGAATVLSELAVPNQAGAPTLPKGYHKMSPRKKAQYINSMKRS